MAGQGNQCLKRRMCLRAQPTDKVEEELHDDDYPDVLIPDDDYGEYDDYPDDDYFHDGADDCDDDVHPSATNRLLVTKLVIMMVIIIIFMTMIVLI